MDGGCSKRNCAGASITSSENAKREKPKIDAPSINDRFFRLVLVFVFPFACSNRPLSVAVGVRCVNMNYILIHSSLIWMWRLWDPKTTNRLWIRQHEMQRNTNTSKVSHKRICHVPTHKSGNRYQDGMARMHWPCILCVILMLCLTEEAIWWPHRPHLGRASVYFVCAYSSFSHWS